MNEQPTTNQYNIMSEGDYTVPDTHKHDFIEIFYMDGNSESSFLRCKICKYTDQ